MPDSVTPDGLKVVVDGSRPGLRFGFYADRGFYTCAFRGVETSRTYMPGTRGKSTT